MYVTFFVVVHVVHFDFFVGWFELPCHVPCRAMCLLILFLNNWRRLLGSMDSEQMITTSLLATHIWRPSIFDGWALRLLVVHSVATVMVPPTAKTRWVCVWAGIPEFSVWMSSYCMCEELHHFKCPWWSLMYNYYETLDCFVQFGPFSYGTWSRPCRLYHWLHPNKVESKWKTTKAPSKSSNTALYFHWSLHGYIFPKAQNFSCTMLPRNFISLLTSNEAIGWIQGKWWSL